jgi:predicted unusual protein kinase regulating ubiquinone biosynthesis (AarF/ABC1/UbiB family)
VGQLEACAAQRITDSQDSAAGPSPSDAASAPATDGARGTPYASPSGGNWTKFKSYSTFRRTWQIWSFAFAFAVRYFALKLRFTYGRAGMTPEAVISRRSKLAAWLREGLVKLGPTFIKIGQQFSTRVDVLSKEFVAELEKLQDNVPAFESAQAVAIVERNLGGPIGTYFDSFDMTPIAAASLGQVHLAKLRGETVVVKVQRPGLKALFDIDLKNIRVLAQWLQKLDPQSDGAARDWVAIYDECSRILYQEIDYRLEGQNADRFRKNFANKDWVKVPKIDWEHTTSEILTMEYCPGIKINRAQQLDAQGIDRKRLAKLSVECYLEQLLTYGFFHADPHPGNIAVDAVGGGRLIYYDFGMMGTIPTDVRSGLLELFYGVYEKDPDRCIGALVTMGVLIPGNDMTAVRRTATFFLSNFEERLAEQRAQADADPGYDSTFKGPRSKAEKKEKRKAILAAIGEDLLVASADKPFRFPATFTFVVRSFTVLDGIGKSLNPRFDISEIAAPYARGLLLEARPQFKKLAEEFRKRASKQNRAVRNLFTGPNMIEDVALTVASLRSGDLKLRVRALEAERALDRVQAQQKAVTTAIVASTLVNVGTVLSVSAMRVAANFSFAGATFFGLSTLLSLLKIKRQQQKEAMITGAA